MAFDPEANAPREPDRNGFRFPERFKDMEKYYHRKDIRVPADQPGFNVTIEFGKRHFDFSTPARTESWRHDGSPRETYRLAPDTSKDMLRCLLEAIHNMNIYITNFQLEEGAILRVERDYWRVYD